MCPPGGAEALGVQLVTQVGQRVGFAVEIRGDEWPGGSGEVGAVEPDAGQLSAERPISAVRARAVGESGIDLPP